MYYFDNKYLEDYLKTGQQLKVLVNKEWLDITDSSDIEDPNKGVGYNIYGKGQTFEYKAIQSIKIDDKEYTLQQLNALMDPGSEDAKDGDKKDSDVSVDPDADTKGKKESIELGDFIMNNDPNSKLYKSYGVVDFINEDGIIYKVFTGTKFEKVSILKEHVKKG